MDNLANKIVITISGVGLLYLGINVFMGGKVFFKGVHSSYSTTQMVPVGVIFIVIGVGFIIAANVTKKRK